MAKTKYQRKILHMTPDDQVAWIKLESYLTGLFRRQPTDAEIMRYALHDTVSRFDEEAMNDTVEVKFNHADLPAWAQKHPAVIELARRNLAYRMDLYTENKAMQKKLIERAGTDHEGYPIR